MPLVARAGAALFLTLATSTFTFSTGEAQDFNYVPGHMNTLNMMRHVQPDEPRRSRPAQRQTRTARCSADSMPASERRRMERRAAQIYRAQGEKAAVAYARQQGMAYRRKLQAQGICP